jgi:hypothetical protein
VSSSLAAHDVATAYAGESYGFSVTQTGHRQVDLSATGTQGGTRTAVIRDGDIADYYLYLAAGPDGVYASTAVIRRFTSIPDEVVRVDPQSLRVVSRRTLSSRGQVVVAGNGVYLLGERVLQRLDPRTLTTVASYSHPIPNDPNPRYFWSIALADGRLWASFGNAPHSDITQLNPTTLIPAPERWPVPARQGMQLVGTPTGVWLAGQDAVERLLPGGKVSAPTPLHNISVNAVADGDGLLVLTAGDHPLTLVHPDGTSVNVGFRGSCYQLTADALNAWMYCGDNDLVRFALP